MIPSRLTKGVLTEMLSRIILIALFFTFAPNVLAQPQSSEVSCDLVKDAIREASQIRKLTPKKVVPCLVRDKQQIREFMLDTIQTQLPPQKLVNEGRLFEAVGIIPPGFDYAKQLVELYVSQIGGYYDPLKHHYVMASWMPASVQLTIAVHELTHALQDQHFNLEKFMDPKFGSSDEQLAHSALVEGDATAVMTDYSRALVGMPSIASAPDVNSVLLQNALGVGLLGGSEIPQALKMLLLFPYSSGLRFVHQELMVGGYAGIDKIFQDPPRSTAEILHPEDYKSKVNRKFEISDQDLKLPSDAVVTYRDSLGEFIISALLSNYIVDGSAVAQAAAGWQADKAVLYTRSGSEKINTIWVIRWRDSKEAQEFCSAYNKALIEIKKKVNPATNYKFSCEGVTTSLQVE